MLDYLPPLLSWRGRASRAMFNTVGLAACLLFLVLFVFIETMVNRASTWLLYPPFLWIMLMLAIRRLHDRGQSAGWLIVSLVPLLGPLWLLIALVFRKGSSGENQYGADPLDDGADYLSVDIHQPGGAQ